MKFCPLLPHSVSEVDRIRYGRCPQRDWVILSVVKIGTVNTYSVHFFSPSQIQTNKIHYVYGEAHNCLIYILHASTHLCQFIEELLSGHCTGYTALHHVLWTETHHTYRLYSSLQTLCSFNFRHLWSALYFIPFYIIL
jgi:hypothetical protein